MSGIDGFTKLLLHCDGADESTSFPDTSASEHTVTANSGAEVDTGITDAFGGNAGVLFLDGLNDYLNIPDSDDWAFGTGDWTIDYWVKFTDIGANNCMISPFDDGFGYRCYISLAAGTAGSIEFTCRSDNVEIARFSTPGSTVTTGQWYHIALVRNSANSYIFVDGVSQSLTYATTPDENTDYPNVAEPLTIGRQIFGWYLGGSMDEIRVSKGIARWTSNFTPPTEPYSSSEETFQEDESVVWNEAELEDITIQEDESIIWNETDDSLQNNFITEDESIIWNETSSESVFTNVEFQEDESVVWNEAELEDITIQEDESIIWNETHSESVPQGTANLGTKIISINPLVFVTYTSPAKITKVDVTDPENITWSAVQITGLEYALDCVYNSTNEYVYVLGADGKVAKIELADLSNQAIINTGETNILQFCDVLSDFLKTYASTDDADGEIVMIDEGTIDSINSDIRWAKQTTDVISCVVNTIIGQLINSDIRFSASLTTQMVTDIRWLQYDYEDLSQYPIDFGDIQVKINGTDLAPLDDVDLRSITITHTKEDYSIASFILHRKFDKPDYNNQGNSSQITNQNVVQIYINGIKEFDGNIQSFSPESENESIFVSARMGEPSSRKNDVGIPLASVGEQLHPYHCLINSISNENPVLIITAIITNSSDLYWNGSEWVGDIEEAQSFASHSAAQLYIDSNPTLSQFTSQEVWPINSDVNTDYFKGVQVNLGTEIEQNVLRQTYISPFGTTGLAEDIENGEFTPRQNYAYFWFAKFENFITGATNTLLQYLGTSLGSLSSDTWRITGASYKRQKVLDNIESDLGWYYVGDVPYNIISTENGKFKSKFRWEDRRDGMYSVKDEQYDYEQYAKDVADLEYSKLQTINSVVLPRVSSGVTISLDGYYYYGIKLLSRINISNTTTANVYNNNNGFPVAVKSITIRTSDMTTVLQCDNQLSVEEMNEIDRNYPDANSDEYIQEQEAIQLFRKYDPNVGGYIG